MKDLGHHVSMHVGQSHIATPVAVGQLFMIHAKLVQHRGPQVVDRGFVFSGMVAQIISGSVQAAPLDSPSGHPQTETIRIMIAAITAPFLPMNSTQFRSSRPFR